MEYFPGTGANRKMVATGSQAVEAIKLGTNTRNLLYIGTVKIKASNDTVIKSHL